MTIELTPEELREWAEIGQAPCDYRTVGRYRELSAKLGSLASAPLALALADAMEEIAALKVELEEARRINALYVVPVAALLLDQGNEKLFAPEVWDALKKADAAVREAGEVGK